MTSGKDMSEGKREQTDGPSLNFALRRRKVHRRTGPITVTLSPDSRQSPAFTTATLPFGPPIGNEVVVRQLFAGSCQVTALLAVHADLALAPRTDSLPASPLITP